MANNSKSKRNEVSAILGSGKRFVSRYVRFHWQADSETKIAIACAKKCMKRAVDRNYFRRINRAECRSRLNPLKLRLLVVARSRIAEVPKKELGKVINEAWTSFLLQYKAA